MDRTDGVAGGKSGVQDEGKVRGDDDDAWVLQDIELDESGRLKYEDLFDEEPILQELGAELKASGKLHVDDAAGVVPEQEKPTRPVRMTRLHIGETSDRLEETGSSRGLESTYDEEETHSAICTDDSEKESESSSDDEEPEYVCPSFWLGWRNARSLMALRVKEDKFGHPIPGLRARLYSLWSLFPCLSGGSLPKLGLGIHLYFLLFQDVIILMMVTTLLHVPHIVLNGLAANHEVWTWTNCVSLGAYGDKSQHWSQAMTEFLVVCLLIFLLSYYKWSIISSTKRHRRNVITSSDYTLLVKNLQPRYKDVAMLKAFFAKYGAVHDVVIVANVSDVITHFNTREYVVLKYEEKLARQKMCAYFWGFGWCYKYGPKLFGVTAAEKRLNQVNTKFERVAKEKAMKLKTTGQAFVTFEDQWSARRAMKDLKRGWWRRFVDCLLCNNGRRFFGRKLKVQTAPEPSDIEWRNMHVGKRMRCMRMCCTWTAVLHILVAALSFIVPIEVAKVYLREEYADSGQSEEFLLMFSAIVLGFFTVIVNFVLKKLVVFLTNQELHPSQTDTVSHTLRKLVVVQFVNTVLLTFLVRPAPSLWYSQGGTADTVFWLVTVNAIVPPINNVIKLPSVLRRLRCLCALTQRQKDKALQPPNFNIFERYAQMIKSVALALCFGPMNPLIYPITVFSLWAQYFTDKIQIMRICQRPPEYTYRLAEVTRTQLSGVFLWYVGFQYVWYFTQAIEEGVGTVNFIVTCVFVNLSVVAAIVFLVFPTSVYGRHSQTQKLARTIIPKEQRREFRDLKSPGPGQPGLQSYRVPLPEELYNSWMNSRYAYILRNAARRKILLKESKMKKKGQVVPVPAAVIPAVAEEKDEPEDNDGPKIVSPEDVVREELPPLTVPIFPRPEDGDLLRGLAEGGKYDEKIGHWKGFSRVSRVEMPMLELPLYPSDSFDPLSRVVSPSPSTASSDSGSEAPLPGAIDAMSGFFDNDMQAQPDTQAQPEVEQTAVVDLGKEDEGEDSVEAL